MSSRGFKYSIWINPTAFRLNHTRIVSSEMHNIKRCHVSNYFFKKDNPISTYTYHLCVQYDGVSYSSKSKPWNFKIHISLFLPILIGQKLQNNSWGYLQRHFPSIFGFKSLGVKQTFPLPSSNPVLFISVRLGHSRTNFFLCKNIVKALYDQIFANFEKSHGIIIVSFVHITVSNVLLGYGSVLIVKHFFICAICDTQIIQLKNIHSFIKSAKRQKSGFPKVGSMIKVDTYYEDFQTSPTSYALCKHFFHCGNSIKLHKSRVSIDFDESSEKLAHGYAHELRSVFKNFSFADPHGNVCVNDVISKVSTFLDIGPDNLIKFIGSLVAKYNISLPSEPFSVNDNINALRFISCGKREPPHLPFHELIIIYNNDVWYILVATIYIFCILPSFVGRVTVTSIQTYFKYFAVIVRLFLGKDVSFDTVRMKQDVFRIVTGTFALACIFLTNAYKSDNMYKIIEPINIKPYKNFDELIQENFTSYTRSSLIWINILNKPKPNFGYNTSNMLNGNFEFVSPHELRIENRIDGNIYSEIMNIQLESLGAIRENDPQEQKLFNHTGLNTDVIHVTNKFYPILESVDTEVLDASDLFYSQQRNEFRKKYLRAEKSLLFNSLKTCSKTALILPTYLCQKYAQNISQTNTNLASHLSVGTETYFQAYQVFSFEGVVPPYILRRMKGLHTSGILEWWQRFVAGSHPTINRQQQLKEPSMHGNILVIFYILLFGLMTACISFLAEVTPVILRVLMKLGGKLYLRIMMAVNNFISHKYICKLHLTKMKT